MKDDGDFGKICLVLESWLIKMYYVLRFVWFKNYNFYLEVLR